MNFVVAFQYHRKACIYIVKAEKDDIFVAVPRKHRKNEEPIFLTKIDSNWLGDCDDKKLIQKIGVEIDTLYQPKANQKAKPVWINHLFFPALQFQNNYWLVLYHGTIE